MMIIRHTDILWSEVSLSGLSLSLARAIGALARIRAHVHTSSLLP